MSVAAMHAFVDRLAASGVGYDQGDRWSFNPARDGVVVIPYGECDCSSSCAAIARAGGYAVDTRDPMWTGNYRAKLLAAGFTAIPVGGLRLAQLVAAVRPGDHLLGPGHVVYVRASSRWWSAENDERGRSSGGRAGDQTGLEARYRTPYMRSRGWEWVLRPPTDPTSPPAPPPVSSASGELPVLPVHPRHVTWPSPPADLVRIVQGVVGVRVDGVRGPRTVAATKALQRRLGLTADGLFGPGTAEAYLLSLPNMYDGQRDMPAAGVRLLQWIVRSRPDGEFGPLTTADVRSAQRWAGLDPDGNAGPETKRKITI